MGWITCPNKANQLWKECGVSVRHGLFDCVLFRQSVRVRLSWNKTNDWSYPFELINFDTAKGIKTIWYITWLEIWFSKWLNQNEVFWVLHFRSQIFSKRILFLKRFLMAKASLATLKFSNSMHQFIVLSLRNEKTKKKSAIIALKLVARPFSFWTWSVFN